MTKNKVVHLFDNGPMDQEQAIKNLEALIEDIKTGKLIRYGVVGETSEGEVVTGWTNADAVQKQILISHLQIDIIWQVVATNLLED